MEEEDVVEVRDSTASGSGGYECANRMVDEENMYMKAGGEEDAAIDWSSGGSNVRTFQRSSEVRGRLLVW